MRAIDADKLYKDATNLWDEADSEDFEKGVFDLIKNAPTITADSPRGKWIPCSERLPSEGIRCLVTVRDKYDGEIHCGDYCEKYGWDIDGCAFYLRDDVLAWMPLPKPWKGADDERVR